jgi:hypothetical protein
VDYTTYPIFFLSATLIFLLVSTATFFTYFYYWSFGTKMHYVYFFFAVVFCIVSIAMTVLSSIRFFEPEDKNNSKRDTNGFLMVFLMFMSGY